LFNQEEEDARVVQNETWQVWDQDLAFLQRPRIGGPNLGRGQGFLPRSWRPGSFPFGNGYCGRVLPWNPVVL